MPSRAILIIGALGFLCLALLALLASQLGTSEVESVPPALQASSPEPVALPEAPRPATPEPGAEGDVQASLHDAYDEPMLAELFSFFDAVHVSYGDDKAQLPTPVRGYFDELVRRLNLEQETYHVTLSAPSLDLADRRAAGLLALFLDAGLEPGILNLTGQTGSDGVTVERS